MTNCVAKVEYDGEGFFGMQRLSGGSEKRTVQGVLEKEISKVFEEEVKVVYASRTDRGVSAYGQVISFYISREVNNAQLRLLCGRINRLLPEDVQILTLAVADEGFAANRGARNKVYEYRVFNGATLPPLRRHGCLHVRQPLNVAAMRAGAAFLVGEHDFTSFCKAECEKNVKTRTIFSIDIDVVSAGENERGCFVTFEVKGDGFLQHMVRIVVGTLLAVGRGEIEASDVEQILQARDRRHKGKTESARGLVLVEVNY